jgi:hypothetical protein
MADMEKILTKIQNLFDLANNNPNENEAIAAAMKAQELMAKYNIELSQLNGDADKEMYEAIYRNTSKHEMKNWKTRLANVIARNFCCKYYLINHGRGKSDVVFYGYKKDATIALEVFTFLYESGNKFAVRYYNKRKKDGFSTKGLMNTYLLGFVAGIKDVLDKQCKALMIVIPKEVEDSYTEMSKNFGTSHTTVRTTRDDQAWSDGHYDGKATMQARAIG